MKLLFKAALKLFVERMATFRYRGLNCKISPNDLMYQTSDIWYLYFGKAAVNTVLRTLKKAGKKAPSSLLDLPCGHGRELRFFINNFPGAHIVACDLDRGAVDFCVETFGVEGFYSEKDPGGISIPYKFDLIWCGSLLTHLDKRSWLQFLDFFSKRLNLGGVLIFSTHGRFMIEKFRTDAYKHGLPDQSKKRMFEDFDKTGFGYGNYSGQDDYGISLSAKEWVHNLIAGTAELQILDYVERGWFFQHDTVSCIRKDIST